MTGEDAGLAVEEIRGADPEGAAGSAAGAQVRDSRGRLLEEGRAKPRPKVHGGRQYDGLSVTSCEREDQPFHE